MKIRPVGAEFVPCSDGKADGRTDMMELIIVFRSFFTKAPKNAWSATVAYIISILSNLKGDAGRKRVVKTRQTAQRTEEAVRTSKAVDFPSPPTTQQSITTTHGSKLLNRF
jgi:hypothetical protein